MEGGQADGGASARPPRAPDSNKRRGLGFDAGPSKRARASSAAEGGQPTDTGISQAAEAHVNGSVPDGRGREQAAAAQAAPAAVDVSGPEAAGARSAPTLGGSAPASPMPQDARPAERPLYTDQCTAFVKNIAPDTTDEQLREAFAGCGGAAGAASPPRRQRQLPGEAGLCSVMLVIFRVAVLLADAFDCPKVGH